MILSASSYVIVWVYADESSSTSFSGIFSGIFSEFFFSFNSFICFSGVCLLNLSVFSDFEWVFSSGSTLISFFTSSYLVLLEVASNSLDFLTSFRLDMAF